MAEPARCDCCETPASEVAVDDLSGLCLYCQPCPWCGRQGTGCDDLGPRGCDPLDAPDGTPCPPLDERKEMRT